MKVRATSNQTELFCADFRKVMKVYGKTTQQLDNNCRFFHRPTDVQFNIHVMQTMLDNLLIWLTLSTRPAKLEKTFNRLFFYWDKHLDHELEEHLIKES